MELNKKIDNGKIVIVIESGDNDLYDVIYDVILEVNYLDAIDITDLLIYEIMKRIDGLKWEFSDTEVRSKVNALVRKYFGL